ncbi:hypothetical protein FJ365_03250 [Candidatus Dependentiae bacterium]|nr:hypothetical protein [Candidatus Dependentiae bacterium]
MKKTMGIFLVIFLLLVVGCHSIDITIHNKQRMAEQEDKHVAKLEKKAAQLRQKAERYAQRAQKLKKEAEQKRGEQVLPVALVSKEGRCSVNKMWGVGDKYLSATDVSGSVSRIGDVHFDDVTIGSGCSVVGDTIMDRSIVHGDVTQVGNFTARTCQLHKYVAITGCATMSDTTIAGNVSITGELLQFENSSCKGLALSPPDSSSTVLKSSHLEQITIKDGKRWSFCGITFTVGGSNKRCKKATIILDDTTVKGDITFEGVQGTVLLRNGGHINGQVIGGTLGQG